MAERDLAAAETGARREWPVFVIGCHRSGTTLVRYLLDAHPDLACPPESKFIAGLQAFTRYPQVLEGLSSLDVHEPAVVGFMRTIVHEVMGQYARRHRKRRWIDKTPNYYKQLSFIDAIFERQVLYLFVVRHPLDTVRSLEQAPYLRPEALVDPDVRSALRRHGHGRRGFAEYWAEVNRTMVTFAPLAGSRARFLRYEDLVADPERCIESVLAFIDEHPAPNLVERAFQRPHDVGFGDWKIRDTHGIHAESIGSFSSWDAAEIDCLWPVVSDFGAIFGYDRAAPIVRPRGGPAGAWNLLAD